MRAVIAKAGEMIKVTEIDYKEGYPTIINEIVGGYVEAIRIRPDLVMWLNEEGKLQNLPPNFALLHKGEPYDIVVGDVVFTCVDEEGGTTDITDDALDYLLTIAEYTKDKDDNLIKLLNL